MNAYQILSHIYNLLGETTPETLLDAEKRASGTELIPVLRALYQIKKSQEGSEVSQLPDIDSKGNKPSLPPPLDGTESNLHELLANNNLRNQELVEVLNQSGLHIELKEKESGSRLISRANRLYSNLSNEKRQRVLTKMRKQLGIDETAGWFEVLHEWKS